MRKVLLKTLRSISWRVKSRAQSGCDYAEKALLLKDFHNIPGLAELYSIFERSPEGRWIIGKDDAAALYKMVLDLRPNGVLELGSGIGASAAIIALALKHLGGERRIVTLEQFEKCVQIAVSLIPADLQSRIDLVRANPTVYKLDRVSRYQYFSGYDWTPSPEHMYDLVLEDGPGPWLEDDQLVYFPCGDTFRFLPNVPPGGRLYIDGREHSVLNVRRYASTYWKYLSSGSGSQFERTDTPLESVEKFVPADRKLEQLKRFGYL